MRNHDTQHLLRPSRVAERFVREPDWPLRQVGSSFAHHSLSVFGMLAPLLALVLAVAVWRVWGRRRLAAQGRWFGVRFGEQVSRAAVESLMSTLAGGLPRTPPRPCSTAARTCAIGTPPETNKWHAARSSVDDSVSVTHGAGPNSGSPWMRSVGLARWICVSTCGWRASPPVARGSCRCGSITALTLPASCWRRCARTSQARVAWSSLCFRRRRARLRIGHAGKQGGCAPAAVCKGARRRARCGHSAG